MEKTINMKIQRITLYAALAVLVIAGIILMTGRANAMNDRSATGSIPLPADRTIAVSEGVETKINFGTNYDYQNYYYFQIKPTKTGYITITSDYIRGSDVALCNSSKKVISVASKNIDDSLYYYSNRAYQTALRYGVKKGTTYFIRVEGASTLNEGYVNNVKTPYVGTIKWTNTAVKKIKYGKKKKKAVKLKKGEVRNGVVLAGNTKHQWYKIKTNKKKFKITFASKNNNGTLYARVHYKSFGKWYKRSLYVMRYDKANKNIGTVTTNKKHMATYYIEVYPDYKTSGAYTLKWK